jgi:hypothetical protein
MLKIQLKPIIIFSLFFLFAFLATAKSVGAMTINAASCSYSDVNSAINAASEGDTVTVPSGSCTWTAQLTITKGITLQGAGVGATKITGAVGNDAFMISYSPSVPANNAAFILTGFTFNANWNSLSLKLSGNPYHPITKIRIHHNEWINILGVGPHDVAFLVQGGGAVNGVIDNNSFTGEFIATHDGTQRSMWDNLTYDFGDANNIYWEDNTITAGPHAGNASAFPTFAGGWGGRYAVRYNTFVTTRTDSGLAPWFDMHGNQPSGVYGHMGGEVYGNIITSTNGYDIKLFAHRGGKALFYLNKAVTTGSTDINPFEEFSDSISPTNNGSASSDGLPQHVSSSYYWGNRQNNDLVTNVWYTNWSGVAYSIHPDVDYHYQGTSFNGASGMGCGTLANRPAACTTGVGYWATNQSCSDLTGMVGKNPATPISGTLYKCTSTNTWTANYTPYTYPHPLRNESGSDTIPPAAPVNVRVN